MKLCVIYNAAPLYRSAVFKAIDQEYDCDWYFGKTSSDIKEMDVSQLKNVHYYRTIGDPSLWVYKLGLLKLLFKKDYQTYLMLAETRSLTDWLFFWLGNMLFKKKRIFIWTHGWYGKEVGLEAKMKLWLYRHVEGTFVYSNYAKGLLIKEGIPEEKLFTIHNSLDYDRQKELRESIKPSEIYKERFGNNNPVLIFIGRLTKVKQLDMLVNAVSDLNQRGHSCNLVFVGDGVELSSLESQVKELGIQNLVWFYGACYDEKTNAELIYNADLCVAPGNVGLTAMHTMVFGTPVISHNEFKWQMPEFEAIHPRETGDFFNYKDLGSLTNTIAKWIHEKEDKREEVRKACFKEIDTQWNPYYQIGIIKQHIK